MKTKKNILRECCIQQLNKLFSYGRRPKNLPYKHAIAAYGASMAGIPPRIAYGYCPKICHAIAAI